jgi:hypothetical protein
MVTLKNRLCKRIRNIEELLIEIYSPNNASNTGANENILSVIILHFNLKINAILIIIPLINSYLYQY